MLSVAAVYQKLPTPT